MIEFVGLRSKMYSVRVAGEDPVKKATGIKGYVIKKTITFDDYVRCLREKCELVLEQKTHYLQRTCGIYPTLDKGGP